MFGSLLREFEEDPFFSEPFSAHQDRVNSIMRSLSEPFGRDPFVSLTDGRERAFGRNENNLHLTRRRDHRGHDFKDPFHSMDSVMANMRNRMFDVQRDFDGLSLGPDAHSFSSSRVMTYSKVGNEQPKIFQAASQTRKAPGGIKETKQALKDSETGIEKVAVGHHIQDRAHVIKKLKNHRTGDEELYQDFMNFDECEAPNFDEEWKKTVSRLDPSLGRSRLPVQGPKHRRGHHAAVMNNEDFARSEKPCASVETTSHPGASGEHLRVKGSTVKARNK